MSLVDSGRIRTRLITERKSEPTYTPNRDCDGVTALRRGLAEYLYQRLASPEFATGRDVRPKIFVYDWVDWEQLAQWPAVYVGISSDVEYQFRSNTPAEIQLSGAEEVEALAPPPVTTEVPGLFLDSHQKSLRIGADVAATLSVEVWANDPRQRQMLVAAVEDALFPVDWMSGFRLGLGYYYGAFADYLPKGVRIEDAADDAVRRLRLASFSVEARMTLMRLVPTKAAARINTVVQAGLDINTTAATDCGDACTTTLT